MLGWHLSQMGVDRGRRIYVNRDDPRSLSPDSGAMAGVADEEQGKPMTILPRMPNGSVGGDRPGGSTSGARASLIVAVLFVLQLVDGIDQTALAFAGPGIRAELGLGAAPLGAAFSAGFLGTALGAIIFGTFNDVIGRRTSLCLSAFCFSGGSLATVLVQTGSQLFAVRLITGIALGGLFPIVATIIAGTVARKIRATAITLVSVGTAAGAALCGPIVAVLGPQFGWRGIFVLGGVVPVVFALLAMLTVPADAKAGWADGKGIERAANPLAGMLTLLHGGRWKATLMIWGGFVAASVPMFFSLSWLPTLARVAKLPASTTAIGPALFSIAGLVTALVVARIMDRVGVVALAVTSALGVPAFLLLGQSFEAGTSAFLMACVLAGAIAVSSVNLMGTVAALMYEDGLRARGVGWAVAVMRLGGAAAPALGGLLIDAGISTANIFALLAPFPALTATAVLWLWRDARKQQGQRGR